MENKIFICRGKEKEENIWRRKKLFVAKEKENGKGKEKILDQVYTVRDSLNELQKEKLDAVSVGTWWDWVSMEQYWLIYDDTWSVEGGSGWYLVVLGK